MKEEDSLDGAQQHSDTPTVFAAGGVVYRSTKAQRITILLIKKVGGFWSLPKGKVEPGETAQRAVLREVKEETGINGVVEELVAQTDYTVVKKGYTQHKTVAYYLIRATGGSLRPARSELISKVRWMPIEKALQRLQRQRLRAVVRAAQTLLQDTNPAAPSE